MSFKYGHGEPRDDLKLWHVQLQNNVNTKSFNNIQLKVIGDDQLLKGISERNNNITPILCENHPLKVMSIHDGENNNSAEEVDTQPLSLTVISKLSLTTE